MQKTHIFFLFLHCCLYSFLRKEENNISTHSNRTLYFSLYTTRTRTSSSPPSYLELRSLLSLLQPAPNLSRIDNLRPYLLPIIHFTLLGALQQRLVRIQVRPRERAIHFEVGKSVRVNNGFRVRAKAVYSGVIGGTERRTLRLGKGVLAIDVFVGSLENG